MIDFIGKVKEGVENELQICFSNAKKGSKTFCEYLLRQEDKHEFRTEISFFRVKFVDFHFRFEYDFVAGLKKS